MIRNLLAKFETTLYVQIWENRVKVTDVNTLKVIEERPLVEFKSVSKGKIIITAIGSKAKSGSINPFSHPRTLCSDFHIGEKFLQELIKRILSVKFMSISPSVIVHPMEKIEGGLTMLEIRAFKEMACGAGARTAVVYQGTALSLAKINFNKLYSEYSGQ